MNAVKDYLRPVYKVVRKRVERLDRAVDRRVLSKDEFATLLSRIGIKEGATVLVHSSMDALGRRVPGLSPVELIQALQRLLGESGTLLMPSFPFTGKQAAYVRKTQVFDVRKTASQVGLVTEVFRRMPAVVRSLHPTHAFAAWGRHAAELLRTHHCGGAFGVTSPIYKMSEMEGIVAGLGTGMRDSFTILHVPEEIHPRACERFFENVPRTMKIVDGSLEVPYELTPLRGDVRRNYDRVERVLAREGILRTENMNGLRCTVAEARPFIERCMRMVDEGKYL